MGPTADFHIASAVILLVVLAYLILDRAGRRSSQYRLFMVLFSATFAMVCCGIARAVFVGFMGMGDAAVFIRAAVLVMQCIIPLILLMYVMVLCHGGGDVPSRVAVVAVLPALCAVVSTVASIATSSVFFIDEGGVTQKGPLYLAVHLCMAFYPVANLCFAVAHRKSLRPTDKLAIWIASIALLVGVAVEMFSASIHLVSFGLTIAVLAIFVTAVSPFEFVDSLTHTYDAGAFRARLAELLRQKTRFSVVIVSVRNVAAISALLGSNAANEMLQLVAQESMHSARTRFVYRMRPSTFVFVVFARRERLRVAKELAEVFDAPQRVGTFMVDLDVAVSHANALDELQTAEDMVQYVDFITTRLHDGSDVPDDQRELIGQFRRSNEIRRYLVHAVDEGLISTYAQPIYSFEQGRFNSVEVLSRLEHPTLGIVPPSEFIEAAEQEGLIVRLGQHQFETLCSFAAENRDELHQMGIDAIKINLSAVELVEAGFGEALVSVMRRHGVDPSVFEFEVTETTATRYGVEVERTVRAIGEAGCRLCMDDFGSGFANLDVVLNLPFTVVKIDRGLLQSATSDDRASALYRSAANMMSDLGFTVVAEGVETAEQDEFVRSLGIDEAQGYFYAKPVPLDQIFSVVKEGPSFG